MEHHHHHHHHVSLRRLAPLVLAMAMIMAAAPGYAQITTACNTSMINSVITPCVNYLTSSSANGSSPTAECCNSVKSLTSGGMDCLCLVVTGSVPFTIPINRTLAISLPRACKLPGVPVQCKTTGSPLPAPGPASLGPSLSPVSAPSTSPPQASSVLPSPVTPSLAPQSDTTTTPSNGTPSASTGSSGRSSDLTPSSAMSSSSYNLLPSLAMIALGFAGLNKHY